MASKKQQYDLPFTHLKNDQNISAYNEFLNLSESEKKSNPVRAALFCVLAGECKSRQKKDNSEEFLKAAKLYLDFARKAKPMESKNAYLCASKCFLNAGDFDEARRAFDLAKQITMPTVEVTRPVVIVDDSKAIVLKLQNYLEKLGYSQILIYTTGNEGLKGILKIIEQNVDPIVLLDMELPDIDGDVIATKLLDKKHDLQIIIITADEKTTERVKTTISSGVVAFIQKPFTIDEVKKTLDVAESEYSLL